jgi:hypothetical protein
MKVTLKEPTQIVYEKRTHEITVDIDGVEYIIRNSEDDNGVDYYVYSENLNDGDWMNPYDIEDEELKDVIEKLANAAYDDFIFGDSKVGLEVDMDELEDY